MSATLACLAGNSIYRFLESGRIEARKLSPRKTPWGTSVPIYLVESAPTPYYLASRYGSGPARPAPFKINSRANLYALKELGVEAVLCWSAAGAISHNLGIGNLVVPDDLIDFSRLRPATFFENSDRGFVRQFPVFCPRMRCELAGVTAQMDLNCHCSGTAAVAEGPRMETPAEVRMLATVGAEIVTHALAPEAFLAKELRLCLAGACYLVDYAETGSRHRPFSTGELFGGLTQASNGERLEKIQNALPELVARLAEKLASSKQTCECGSVHAPGSGCSGSSGEDWHTWFESEMSPPAP